MQQYAQRCQPPVIECYLGILTLAFQENATLQTTVPQSPERGVHWFSAAFCAGCLIRLQALHPPQLQRSLRSPRRNS